MIKRIKLGKYCGNCVYREKRNGYSYCGALGNDSPSISPKEKGCENWKIGQLPMA